MLKNICVLIASLAVWGAGTATSSAQEAPMTPMMVQMELIHGDHALHAPNGQAQVVGGRSVPLALGLSAAIPGLGQAYNRQWVKAAVALGLEVGLFIANRNWNSTGRDLEQAFQLRAHADWDPAKYALWIQDYAQYLNTNHGGNLNGSVAMADVDLTQPEAWSDVERALVRSMFDDIRAIEAQAYHVETGATFSHKLPFFAEQQYYELIGKYFQFAPGWRDYGADASPDDTVEGRPWLNADGTFNDRIDPEHRENGERIYVSDDFFEYANETAEANDYLRRASRVSAFIVLNHFIAAIDAAVSAKLHNDRMSTSLQVYSDHAGRPEVFMRIGYRF
ncbi:MAG: DUF5683 domain-containing protein [Bacteroidota bacterium]